MKIHEVSFARGATRWDNLPADGLPEIAFIGRSNVGKSSLLNMLVGRRSIARISNTPGKTQEFNFYLINRRFYLVDLPGFGYAKVSKVQRAKWQRFIGQYVTERAPLRAVFHLIDSRHPPTALDEEVMLLMHGSPVPYIIALTKADKLSGNQRGKSQAAVARVLESKGLEVPIVMTSAQDKRGRGDLLRWIGELLA